MRMKARVSFGLRGAGFDEVRRTLFPNGDVAQGIVVAYHLEEFNVYLTGWVKVRGDVQGVLEDGAVVENSADQEDRPAFQLPRLN